MLVCVVLLFCRAVGGWDGVLLRCVWVYVMLVCWCALCCVGAVVSWFGVAWSWCCGMLLCCELVLCAVVVYCVVLLYGVVLCCSVMWCCVWLCVLSPVGLRLLWVCCCLIGDCCMLLLFWFVGAWVVLLM